MSSSSWDTDSLEKAVSHLRELNASKHAAAAIELARHQQEVEKEKLIASGKKSDVDRVIEMGNVERIRATEQRKLMDHHRQIETEKAEYQFRKDIELMKVKNDAARARDEENRRAALEDERVKVAIRLRAGMMLLSHRPHNSRDLFFSCPNHS